MKLSYVVRAFARKSRFLKRKKPSPAFLMTAANTSWATHGSTSHPLANLVHCTVPTRKHRDRWLKEPAKSPHLRRGGLGFAPHSLDKWMCFPTLIQCHKVLKSTIRLHVQKIVKFLEESPKVLSLLIIYDTYTDTMPDTMQINIKFALNFMKYAHFTLL